MKKDRDILKDYDQKSLLLNADGSTLLFDKKYYFHALKGGQNTLVACSIAHHLSVKMLSTDCHRWSVY